MRLDVHVMMMIDNTGSIERNTTEMKLTDGEFGSQRFTFGAFAPCTATRIAVGTNVC